MSCTPMHTWCIKGGARSGAERLPGELSPDAASSGARGRSDVPRVGSPDSPPTVSEPGVSAAETPTG